MPDQPTRPPVVMIAVVLLALVALLAGCGGTKGHDQKSSGSSSGGSGGSGGSGDKAAADPGYGAPKLGACHRLTSPQSYASVDTSSPVSCDKRHTTVVSFVGYLKAPVSAATPITKRHQIGVRMCDPAYRRLAGGTLADRATSLLTWTLFTPDQDQLEHGARWVRCDVLARTSTGLVPLPGKTPFLTGGVPEALRICQTDAGLDISCGQPHAFRVAAVFQAAGSAYPAPARYTRIARARCRQLTGTLGGYWQPPSLEGWRDGDTFIRCLSQDATTPTAPSSSTSP